VITKSLNQVARFVFVGGIATAVHVVVAIFAIQKLKTSSLSANFLGYSVSVSVSYFLNSVWTFRVVSPRGGQFPKYVLISIVGLLINQAITYLVTEIFHYSYYLAILLVISVVPIITYTLSKHWAFTGKSS